MIEGMANAPKWTTAGVKALATAVKKRRDEELGLTQLEVGRRGGPANSTMTSIEKAASLYITWHTLRALDRGLDWPEGNALRIVSGHEPLDHASFSKSPVEDKSSAELVDTVLDSLIELLRRRIQDSEEDWPPSFLQGDPEAGRA